MAYLPSLPGGAVMLDVFCAYPQTARPLLDYNQALLRGPSPSPPDAPTGRRLADRTGRHGLKPAYLGE